MKKFGFVLILSLTMAVSAFAGEPLNEKISSELQAVLSKRGDRGSDKIANAVSRYDADRRLQVYIHVISPLGAAERSALEGMGVEIERERDGIVQGRVSPELIPSLTELPFVRKISLPSYAVPRSGGSMTQGDAILRSDLVRSLGYDGTGVKVGVISNGIGGLGEAQVSGDLGDVQVVGFSGSGSEGTAMLEIIHDIAPGAQLAFCGPSTSLDFIECVNELATTFGADVIVDDLGFYGEPVFEDGPVAQAVGDVIDNFGVLYASSAGNDGQRHYQSDFLPSNLLSLKGNEHDFGAAAGGTSDATLNVIVSPHTVMAAVLEWNDPFGASDNDYDLYVVSEDEKTTLASSKNVQNGNDDPVEIVFIQNDSDFPGRAKLAVTKVDGENRKIKVQCVGADRLEEYQTPQASIFGHPAVPGVLAVGAVSAFDAGQDLLQPFSSQGPVEIYFPTYEIRYKPDLVATDTVSVSGAGGFPSVFSGTSAAAPHAAAVAALLKPLFPFAPALKDRLKATALDRGEPGFDFLFGAGFLDAFQASGLTLPEKPPVPEDRPEESEIDTPQDEGKFPDTVLEDPETKPTPVRDDAPAGGDVDGDDRAVAASGCSLALERKFQRPAFFSLTKSKQIIMEIPRWKKIIS